MPYDEWLTEIPSLISGWLPWIITVIVGVFAIRATIRFDLNEWLRDRREHKIKALMASCPHVMIITGLEKKAVRSRYVSPVGSLAFRCEGCGMTVHTEQEIRLAVNYWNAHLDELEEKIKKRDKIAKKLGVV